jgi:c-di-GMP-binding flagellar brake protein YcgR
MPLVAEYRTEPSATSTRKHARSLFSVPFELRQLKGPAPHPLHAISLDISEGGVGALVQGNLSVGEAVQVDLPLAGTTIHIVAVVRHTSALRSGFEFLRLSDGARRQITRVMGAA